MVDRQKKKYIVIGAGPAGWSLVQELSKNETIKVLIIEKGSDSSQTNDLIQLDPLSWAKAAFSRGEASRYRTVPQYNLYNRVLLYPQGIGIGGSSNINAMIFTATHKAVFDHYWPSEWNSNVINRLLESCIDSFPVYPASSAGIMRKILLRDSILEDETLRESTATTRCSIWDTPRNTDYFYAVQNHRRVLLSQQFTWQRNNVQVMTHTTAVSIEFESDRAVGVVLRDRYGKEWLERTENGGEVILCCGAFESPRLLFASGFVTESIGKFQKSDTERPQRKVRVLPSLGRSLFDHVTLPVVHVGNWWDDGAFRDSCPQVLCLLFTVAALVQLFVATLLGFPSFAAWQAPLGVVQGLSDNGVHGWMLLDERGEVIPDKDTVAPSVQLLLVDGRILCGMIAELSFPNIRNSGTIVGRVWLRIRPALLRIFEAACELQAVQALLSCVFGFLVCLVKPSSSGTVRPDPAGTELPLLIDPKYLSTAEDVEALRKGVATARRILQSVYHSVELLPGPMPMSAYIPLFSGTYFHACGTCAMSPSSGGVVGPDLRVRGVDGLRVADASVLPHIPSGPTQAACVAIGKGAANLLLRGTVDGSSSDTGVPHEGDIRYLGQTD